MDTIDFNPFLLSFKLAFFTTLILLIIGIPIAWKLSKTKSKLKPFIESIIALPIVLPPSVLGFYLLIFFSPNSILGKFLLEHFNLKLLFSFEGLIVGSVIYSMPFMIQPLQGAFEKIPKNIIEASYLCGKGEIETLFKVVIPNIKPSLISAIVITFAHTVGEFGVVLMIGGSIPNETRVASVAIYDFVEELNYKNAHIYSLIMLIISFLVLFLIYFFKQRKDND